MPNINTFHDTNQEAPGGLFSNLMKAWGNSSLGNMQGQRVAADEYSLQETNTHLQFNTQPESDSPSTRLRALKASQFPTANKAERIQRSLQALNHTLGISLPAELWAVVTQQAEEDEE